MSMPCAGPQSTLSVCGGMLRGDRLEAWESAEGQDRVARQSCPLADPTGGPVVRPERAPFDLDGDPPRLLVVDDSQPDQLIYRHMLRGYALEFADSGERAWSGWPASRSTWSSSTSSSR